MARAMCHLAFMDYTLSQLASLVARTTDAEQLKTVSRRIEHWQTTSLFYLAEIDLGPKRLGRGRVRRYPTESLVWCRIWNAMANLGLGVQSMALPTMQLHYSRGNAELKAALRGEGPALFLMFEENVQHGTSSCSFQRAPISLDDNFQGGSILNLTAIFKQ